jgi:hypothetical protein
MEMRRCSVCGYIHEGEGLPVECAKCDAESSKLGRLDPDAVQKIQRARFTNSLHLQVFSLLEDARDIADAGIEDDLDPACTKIFEELGRFAAQMQRKINAELETHVRKGKWG